MYAEDFRLDDLVRLRIRKARELAVRGDSDAAAVAKAVGFHDTSYFKKVYLRYTGTDFPTPMSNFETLKP